MWLLLALRGRNACDVVVDCAGIFAQVFKFSICDLDFGLWRLGAPRPEFWVY
jgi:hypothetical protein